MRRSLELEISSPQQLPIVAEQLLAFFEDKKVILFNGEMGAGKTTLIKAICGALGSNDNFSSPTYSIINEYHSLSGPLYHFDLYRVKDEGEMRRLGLEDYLDSGNYCFFEWPVIAREMMDMPVVDIEIILQGNNRYIRASHI